MSKCRCDDHKDELNEEINRIIQVIISILTVEIRGFTRSYNCLENGRTEFRSTRGLEGHVVCLASGARWSKSAGCPSRFPPLLRGVFHQISLDSQTPIRRYFNFEQKSMSKTFGRQRTINKENGSWTFTKNRHLNSKNDFVLNLRW